MEQAKEAARLDELKKDLRQSRASLEKEIANTIDVKKDYAEAAGLVRKLQFLDKLDTEIDAAYEMIE